MAGAFLQTVYVMTGIVAIPELLYVKADPSIAPSHQEFQVYFLDTQRTI